MDASDLPRLRQQRFRLYGAIERQAAIAEANLARLMEIEATIERLSGKPPAPFKRRRHSEVFRFSEVSRLALTVLREAGKPLSIHESSLRMLGRKGIAYPSRELRRTVRRQLSDAFVRLGERGIVARVGRGSRAKRELI